MTPTAKNSEADASSLILTPADFADTGQWRLIMYVATDGIGAVLRHVSDISRPAVQLFAEHWQDLKGKALLEKIENSIYEHPGVLDDYATEIIVSPTCLTWIPTEIIENVDYAEETIFDEMFPDAEVMVDRIGEITALYSLANGFDGFIARTIPGARIRCDLSVLESRLRPSEKESVGLIVKALMAEDSVCLFAYHNNRLLLGARYKETDPEVINSLIKDICNIWVEGKDKINIKFLFCRPNDSGSLHLTRQAKEICDDVEVIQMPAAFLASGLPPATSMVVFREIDLPAEQKLI